MHKRLPVPNLLFRLTNVLLTMCLILTPFCPPAAPPSALCPPPSAPCPPPLLPLQMHQVPQQMTTCLVTTPPTCRVMATRTSQRQPSREGKVSGFMSVWPLATFKFGPPVHAVRTHDTQYRSHSYTQDARERASRLCQMHWQLLGTSVMHAPAI